MITHPWPLLLLVILILLVLWLHNQAYKLQLSNPKEAQRYHIWTVVILGISVIISGYCYIRASDIIASYLQLSKLV